MKKRISFALVCTLFAAFLLFTMVHTFQKKAVYIANDKDVVKSEAFSGLIKSSEQKYEYTGDDKDTRYVSVKLKDVVTDIAQIKVYVDYGNGYDISSKKNVCITEGSQYGYFTLASEEFTSFLIEPDISYEIETIDFHANEHSLQIIPVKPFVPLVILSGICLVLVFCAAYILQGKVDAVGYITGWGRLVWSCRAKLVRMLLIACVELLFACGVSLLITRFKDYVWTLNSARTIWIYAAVLICTVFVVNRRNIETGIDRILFWIIIIMGAALIIISPVSHKTWDIDSHYRWALIDSYLGRASLTQADLDVFNAYEESLLGDTYEENKAKEKILEEDYEYVVASDYGIITLPHMPAGIMMAAARLAGCSFAGVYKAGEWGNLIVYAILCYIAIRKLKRGKMILMVAALFPTNLMLATNYSYDYWIIGFTFVGMAYFIGNYQEKGGYISTKDTVIMAGAFLLACVPKEIYIMFLLIPFLMPKSRIKNKRSYYTICCTGLVIIFLMLGMRTISTTGGAGDTRGGAVMPALQIQYIFNNIGQYMNTLLTFLGEYLSLLNVKDYTMDFAYYGMAGKYVHAVTVLLIVAAVTDKAECDNYETSAITRCYLIGTYVITAALMATALYISYTPVGEAAINGCQPRYLIPMVFPLAAVAGSGKISNHMDKKIYYYLITGASTILLYISIYDVVIKTVIG